MGSPINKIHYKEGDKVGECIYLSESHSGSNWKRYCKFRCHCGKEFIANITKIRIGHTKSCGCKRIETVVSMNTTHGMSQTGEYHSWDSMIQRCTNPKNNRYSEWGGRGIEVCERWLDSFENFFEDMGLRPTPNHSLERKNNGKGYGPTNCRWATQKEQSLNRRSNHVVEYNGEKKPLKELTEKHGLRYDRVIQRINTLGWSVKDAFEKPKSYVNV